MNKFNCWLVDVNSNEYKTLAAKDKKDFKNFSTLLKIVLIAEFLGIFNATHYILDKNYLISFFAALTWAYFVLLIENLYQNYLDTLWIMIGIKISDK